MFMYAPALYQAKYLEDTWKIPSENYGIMNVVTAFSIIASLCWSGLADRFRLHRHVLVLKSMLYALSYCTMWVLEPFMIHWTQRFKMTVITFLFFTTTVFCSAIFPLLGTLVFAILENSPSLKNGSFPPKRLLGRQKLFGTIGVAIVFAINGLMTDYIGYRAQFLIVAVTCVLFSIVAWTCLDDSILSQQPPKKASLNDSEANLPNSSPHNFSFKRNLRVLLNSFDFLLLLFIVFLMGVIGSMFNMYMSIFMSKILGTSSRKGTSIGFMNSVRLLVELPIYFLGDKLLAWFGAHGVLLIGMTSSVVRPFGYAYFIRKESDARMAFFFELFKGISHTTNAIGGCVLASDLAPAAGQGTAQALFTSAHHHAASVISGLFCSYYLKYMRLSGLDTEGQINVYRSLFRIAGLLGCFGCALNLGRILFGRTEKRAQIVKR